MKELLRKKSIKIALLLIVAAFIAVIVGMNVQSTQKKNEYNVHIEAAEKYLTELDYEQAIAEYTLALEIEPNAEEVLNGLEKTYLAYADALLEAGDYEKAIQILNEGYAQTGRESLKEKLTQIEPIQSYMQQVYDLMVAGNYLNILQVLQNMSEYDLDSLLQEGAYLYFPQGNGKKTGIGVGIYPLHNWYRFTPDIEENIWDKYAFYYGNFVDGKREGSDGSYYIYHWLFRGEWENDMPNGYGEVVVADEEQEKIMSGTLVNGLWDGTVTLAGVMSGSEYTIQVNHGIPEDKTEAFLEWERSMGVPDDREWLNERDYFVYAYEYDTVEDGIASMVIENGETMGIWGFANILY